MPALTLNRRRWAAFAAVLALLCAQALGLAHRMSHGAAQVQAHALSADLADVVGGAHEQGGIECRLIDQTCHSDALVAGDAAALPVTAAASDEPALRGAAAPARPAERPYCARAPPPLLA